MSEVDEEFKATLKKKISEIESYRKELIDNYPAYFKANEKYFNNLMLRAIQDEPINY